MLEFNTNTLKTRKKVLIDGHEYTVRRLGNIEQLDISQYMRRLQQLADIEKANDNQLSDEETKEADDIGAKLSHLFVGLFDDGGDQSKSRTLVASLSDKELGMLISQIFEEDSDGTTEVS